MSSKASSTPITCSAPAATRQAPSSRWDPPLPQPPACCGTCARTRKRVDRGDSSKSAGLGQANGGTAPSRLLFYGRGVFLRTERHNTFAEHPNDAAQALDRVARAYGAISAASELSTETCAGMWHIVPHSGTHGCNRGCRRPGVRTPCDASMVRQCGHASKIGQTKVVALARGDRIPPLPWPRDADPESLRDFSGHFPYIASAAQFTSPGWQALPQRGPLCPARILYSVTM